MFFRVFRFVRVLVLVSEGEVVEGLVGEFGY